MLEESETKKAVAEGLRWPGYQHEWLMIASAKIQGMGDHG